MVPWSPTARNASGTEIGIFDFVYDRAHQRIRFASYDALTPTDPRYGHTFPYISANTALGRLQGQSHMSAMPGTAPQFIFFSSPDPRVIGPQATRTWTGGGVSPVEPAWLITGRNGLNYVVGTDLHVYSPAELPIV